MRPVGADHVDPCRLQHEADVCAVRRRRSQRRRPSGQQSMRRQCSTAASRTMRTSGSTMARSATWHALHDNSLLFQTSFMFMLVNNDQLDTTDVHSLIY